MLIIVGIIIAVLVVAYLYFLLNKAVEEPKSDLSGRDPKKLKKNEEKGEF
ncbi:MAG: hypothetical protein ACM34J_00505 [Ignavibacteria bacterium]